MPEDRKRADFASLIETAPGPINLVAGPTWRVLVALAARHWGVRFADVVGPCRDTLVVTARHHAMWLCRTHAGLSLKRIGQVLGGRDHTTVIHGIRQHEARRRGELPVPYIWVNGGFDRFRRLLRAGRTPDEARRALGMTPSDLLRCPHYHQLRREVTVLYRHRAMQRALSRKAQPSASRPQQAEMRA